MKKALFSIMALATLSFGAQTALADDAQNIAPARMTCTQVKALEGNFAEARVKENTPIVVDASKIFGASTREDADTLLLTLEITDDHEMIQILGVASEFKKLREGTVDSVEAQYIEFSEETLLTDALTVVRCKKSE